MTVVLSARTSVFSGGAVVLDIGLSAMSKYLLTILYTVYVDSVAKFTLACQ